MKCTSREKPIEPEDGHQGTPFQARAQPGSGVASGGRAIRRPCPSSRTQPPTNCDGGQAANAAGRWSSSVRQCEACSRSPRSCSHVEHRKSSGRGQRPNSHEEQSFALEACCCHGARDYADRVCAWAGDVPVGLQRLGPAGRPSRVPSAVSNRGFNDWRLSGSFNGSSNGLLKVRSSVQQFSPLGALRSPPSALPISRRAPWRSRVSSRRRRSGEATSLLRPELHVWLA